MAAQPHLPLFAIACISYPLGGITSPAVAGCAVGIRVQRNRRSYDHGRVVKIQEYLNVATWVEAPDIESLAEALQQRAWDSIWIWRRPSALYDHALQCLPKASWHCMQEDWNDDTLVTIANGLLRRIPVNSGPEFLGACEARPNVRRAFAGAVAGLCTQIHESTLPAARPIESRRVAGGGSIYGRRPDFFLGQNIGYDAKLPYEEERTDAVPNEDRRPS